MNPHPAVERALAYLRRKGTEAPGERVQAKVAATYARFEGLLEGISAELATRKPDPETWCVQEVVDHLALSLEPATDQLRALILGEPPGDAVPAGLLGDDALDRSWPEAVARLQAVHRSSLQAVAEAVEADPPLDRKAPVAMVIKVAGDAGGTEVLEWTEHLDWKSFALVGHIHTLEHVDQIRRILERLDGAGGYSDRAS